ncbi:NitT/TauT family transport system permease protein [Cytobacillus eiseniae]|uniref:NitT/TauT family transport system permease protein n=1 Tax=Cytobacillus eiseniae TaxID=762947 RepID=A0ABS4RFI0_9BACI|nr:ABC transporter permease [Cytobacillus eiseniae]MBP2241508.1 NitT/TauT family transport system permease protein [Cytobacillus eiseniae]
MKGSITKNKHSYFMQAVTIVFILIIWVILSNQFPSILIPSPVETFQGFLSLVESGELFEQLLTSITRMAIGFTIGMVLATGCGLLAGKYPLLYEAFRPIISILLGIPPIILVVLAMVWFGTGSLIPILVVSVLVFPTFFLNTADGWRNIDSQLLEMAKLYNRSPLQVLKDIIIPSLTVPIFTAISLAAGSSVRITIMAELLGSDNGIGASLSYARINIDTAKVFAWTLLSILIIIAIDYLVINPFKKVILRWKVKE